MATRQEIVDSIRSGISQVEETFGKLTDEQLRAQIHEGDGGWTAKQVLAHLAGRARGYERTIHLAESGEVPAALDFNRWNQDRVEERIHQTRDELLAEFRSVHEALIERVQGISDALLAKQIVRPNGTLALSDALAGGGGRHSVNHSNEVQQSLQRAQ